MQQGFHEGNRLELHVVLVFWVPPPVVVRVDGDLVELRETDPVGSEVGDETIDTWVGKHPLCLGTQLKICDGANTGGEIEVTLVGDAPPQERGQEHLQLENQSGNPYNG